MFVRILVEMVDAVGVERGGAALDAVDLIALGEQELRQVGAILASDAGNKGFLHGRVEISGAFLPPDSLARARLAMAEMAVTASSSSIGR